MINLNVLLNKDSESHEVVIDFAVHPVESSVPIVVSGDASETACISILFIYSVSS